MKFAYFFLIALVLSIATITPANAKEKWELVWSDEFDYRGLPDPMIWDYEEGLVRNEEAQYYTRTNLKNAHVEDGVLTIEARKERVPNTHYVPAQNNWMHQNEYADYTSASLITKGRMDFKYGRVEVRAKVPAGKGTWPAIWTLGIDRENVHWPRCGEIDIMEYLGRDENGIYGSAHFAKQNGEHVQDTKRLEASDPASDFHVYAIEWTPARIDFYFDDKKYHTFWVGKANNGMSNPFRKPHYLLLSLALGGNWGKEINDATLPAKFLIDYVRIYQKPT